MENSGGSKSSGPFTLSFNDRIYRELLKRGKFEIMEELLDDTTRNNHYLNNSYFMFVRKDNQGRQYVHDQAEALRSAFHDIIVSIARTGGIAEVLINVTRVLTGVSEAHVAKNFDGYLLLLEAYNLRLYSKNTHVLSGPLYTHEIYTIKSDHEAASPMTLLFPPASGRINLLPLLDHWFDFTYPKTDSAKPPPTKDSKLPQFSIGEFVNALCGSVAMRVLGRRWTTKRRLDLNGTGSREFPVNIGLPSLHLLSIS